MLHDDRCRILAVIPVMLQVSYPIPMMFEFDFSFQYRRARPMVLRNSALVTKNLVANSTDIDKTRMLEGPKQINHTGTQRPG